MSSWLEIAHSMRDYLVILVDCDVHIADVADVIPECFPLMNESLLLLCLFVLLLFFTGPHVSLKLPIADLVFIVMVQDYFKHVVE